MVHLDTSTNTINIDFMPGVAVYNLTETQIGYENIYNSYGKCRDDAFMNDWTEILQDEYNIKQIINSLKARLNDLQNKELDNILSQEYGTLEQNLIDNSALGMYKMSQENQFEIVKLLSYYRYSLFGKTTLTDSIQHSISNLYSSDNTISDVCDVLLTDESYIDLDYPTCSFEYKQDGTLAVSIMVDDITEISPNQAIQFKDALVFVDDTIMPVAPYKFTPPVGDIEVEMLPKVTMKESITTCEGLAINFQGSMGLGSLPVITIELNAIQNVTTGDLDGMKLKDVNTQFATKMKELVAEMISMKSRELHLNSAYLNDFAGYKLYFTFIFKNTVTLDVARIYKKITIIGSERLEISDAVLKVQRDIPTDVDVARIVSCNQTNQASPGYICKANVLIYDEAKGSQVPTTKNLTNCIIDPSIITVENIKKIWIETTINGQLTIVNVKFELEDINCGCDLSKFKSVYGMSDTLTVNTIKCSKAYSIKWKLVNMLDNTVTEFNTLENSFSISRVPATDTSYKMTMYIVDATTMTVGYGTCNTVIDVLSVSKTLNTQIRGKGINSLQDKLELEIVTFDENNEQVEIDSLQLTLIIDGGDFTNLLETTFLSLYKLKDNKKLVFDAGIWQKDTKYLLKAIVQKGSMFGMGNRVINSKNLDLFAASVSPKTVKTGEKVTVTIQSKTAEMCLYCAVGLYINNQFEPYKILNNPDRLCGFNELRKTSFAMPLLTEAAALKTELAVICIGSNEGLSDEEKTQLKKYKIEISKKQLVTADVMIESVMGTIDMLDENCLSVMSLPASQCPNSEFEYMCMEAIQTKSKYIDRYSGALKRLWKQLNNKLIFAFVRIITCGSEPFVDERYDIVDVILDGL